MGPDALAQVLRPLQNLFSASDHPDLIRGLASPDDAAVWKLNEGQAVVLTADFFPPVVDDPFTYGRIAAANALSDLYAMGADPRFCLNIVGFPQALDPGILSDILRGGADAVREAGAVIAGGHTVTDEEPKYGLAALGLVDPAKLWTNSGAKEGDVAFLTKPLGTGVVATAIKKGKPSEQVVAAAVESMSQLNRAAMEAIRSSGVKPNAVTDITGFGFAGHLHEMAAPTNVCLKASWGHLPFIEGVPELLEAGFTTGGARRNQSHFGPHVQVQGKFEPWQENLLFDPQTSGGLLFAVPASDVTTIRAKFSENGLNLYELGTFHPSDQKTLEVDS